MTPAEFRSARRTLGLSQAQLGYILDVDARTVRRWEASGSVQHRPPSPTACRVISWMLDGYRPPQHPDNL
jgi:DNA-binding transcriptional regulator YiaG